MASLPDRLRQAADELESLRCAEDAALMREAAEALDPPRPLTTGVDEGASGYWIERVVGDESGGAAWAETTWP